MPSMIINNKTLHYLDQGVGPVLFFGHSYLFDSAMWKEQIAEFSKDYRCIVPDLWGHGDSAPLNEKPSIQSLADDHWALLAALHIKSVCLIGLSVGGMWATQLALDHPSAVEKLVIMDSFLGIEATDTQQQYLHMLNIVEQANALPSTLIEQLIPIFLSAVSLKNKPALATAFSQSLNTLATENISSIVAIGRCIFKRKDRMSLLAQLKMPVLILTGELDRPRPPHEAKQMADLISNSEYAVIAHAGHISALEQPEAVNQRLRSFLATSS